MSFNKAFQTFNHSTRIIFNDRFIGDDGASELAHYLTNHANVQYLQIKSNDISAMGFADIFEALLRSQNLKQLNLEYNRLGENQHMDWQEYLGTLITQSPKLQRLNLSNNKINGREFLKLIPDICHSKSLQLLELKHNYITTNQIDQLVAELKAAENKTLLFVQLSGNRIKSNSLNQLEAFLKANQGRNPTNKDKFLMTGKFTEKPGDRPTFQNRTQNTFIDNLSKQGTLKQLEIMLDQNRKQSAERKVRLENELAELIRQDKLNLKEINQLEGSCNQLIIQNRTLKFQLDRTIAERQQFQRDQQNHIRHHEDKMRQADKEIKQIHRKFEESESRISHEHQMKIKQSGRDWESRLRIVQDRIRQTESQNILIENQMRRMLQKRQKIKIQYIEDEGITKTKLEEQQLKLYDIRLKNAEMRSVYTEEIIQKYINRNQGLIYEIEQTDLQNKNEINDLEEEYSNLKVKQEEFVSKNKEFQFKNQKIVSEIRIKEVSITKMKEQIKRLIDDINKKKNHNADYLEKIIRDHEREISKNEEEKSQLMNRLRESESTLRKAQMQHAKLRQEYTNLAHRLQVALGQTVYNVFVDTKLI